LSLENSKYRVFVLATSFISIGLAIIYYNLAKNNTLDQVIILLLLIIIIGLQFFFSLKTNKITAGESAKTGPADQSRTETIKSEEHHIRYDDFDSVDSKAILEENDIKSFCAKLFSELESVGCLQGALYSIQEDHLKLHFTYNYLSENEIERIEIGEGLSGQVAETKKPLILNNVNSRYFTCAENQQIPKSLLICPVLIRKKIAAVIELAASENFYYKENKLFLRFFNDFGRKIKELTNVETTDI
jgi:putative methionine-R-sulfoxide reductase with GAF domain